MDQASAGHTVQNGRIRSGLTLSDPDDVPVVIERIDTPQPTFLSLKLGRDVGASFGWTDNRDDATRLRKAYALEMLDTSLMSVSQSCKVVPL